MPIKIERCVGCHKPFETHTTGKRCMDCYWKENEKTGKSYAEAKKVAKRLFPGKRICSFCSSEEKVHVHHVDFDKHNQEPYNLILLCAHCHRKVHSMIQRPVLKRIFTILQNERFTLETIGDMFGTTRQNVHGIIKRPIKKLSTGKQK